MKTQALGTLWECDSCGLTQLQTEGDPRPEGYYGTVEQVHHVDDAEWVEDGKPKEWHACRRSHVTKAINNVLNGVRGGA